MNNVVEEWSATTASVRSLEDNDVEENRYTHNSFALVEIAVEYRPVAFRFVAGCIVDNSSYYLHLNSAVEMESPGVLAQMEAALAQAH